MQYTEYNSICFKIKPNLYVYAFVDHRLELKNVNTNLLTVVISKGKHYIISENKISSAYFQRKQSGGTF